MNTRFHPGSTLFRVYSSFTHNTQVLYNVKPKQLSRIPISFKLNFSSETQSKQSGEPNWKKWGVIALFVGIPTLIYITNSPSKKSKNSTVSDKKQISDLSSKLNKVSEIEVTEKKQISSPSEIQIENNKIDTIVSREIEAVPGEGAPEEPLLEVESTTIKKSLPETYVAKYVLLGAGTASYSAMKSILEKDPSANIIIIGEELEVPYMRPPLSKELWFNEDTDVASTLIFKNWQGQKKSVKYEDDNYYQNITSSTLGDSVKLIKGQYVTSLNAEDKYLILENGDIVTFDKLLVATGGKPKVLQLLKELPRQMQKYFMTYRTTQDFRVLENLSSNDNKTIMIVGGSFLGSELACALASRAKLLGKNLNIIQIYPEDGNMGLLFPRYLSQWTMQKVRSLGIQVKPNVTLQGVQETDSVTGKLNVNLSNGETITVDKVVMCVGISPNVEIAKNAGLETDERLGGIIVNSELQARSDIWAAGDVCSFHDITLGRRRVEHHDNAILTGKIAGENMTGIKKPYKHQSMFWSDLGPEIGYEAVGLIDAKLQTVGIWAKSTKDDTPRVGISNPENIRISDVKDIKESAIFNEKKNESDTISGTDLIGKITEEIPKEEYGKGVVFYLKDQKVVGVLFWNIFNQVDAARKIIAEGNVVEDVQSLAKAFKVH